MENLAYFLLPKTRIENTEVRKQNAGVRSQESGVRSQEKGKRIKGKTRHSLVSKAQRRYDPMTQRLKDATTP
jgi:hypothetical protein